MYNIVLAAAIPREVLCWYREKSKGATHGEQR
jgi:hypothetical protein